MILAVLNPRGAHPKSAGRNLLVATTNLIVKLPIPIGVTAKGFADPHFHREQHIHQLWHPAACYELSTEFLDQLGKTVNGTFLQPVKHLNVVGLRLEGKTLHISASLWVCRDIIWM